jgi:hypothetical protein
VENGDVKLKWVPTQQQQADIFTKALHRFFCIRAD